MLAPKKFEKKEYRMSKLLIEKLKRICKQPIQRVLFVVQPEIPEDSFRLQAARNKRYACFPPYGPVLLSQRLQEKGYEARVLDLNYWMLEQAHTQDDFTYDRW